MWIDQKYISLLSSSVRNFKKKSNNVWEFSCPICGDSATNKRKARGYIFLKARNYRFMCHNCGASMYFSKLLEHINPNLYREYRFEKFRDSDSFVEKEVEPDEKAGELYFTLQTNSIDKLAQKISTLDESHEAYRYLKSRKIPMVWFDRLYYSDDLNQIATLFPGKYDPEETKFAKEPRIIIPIYNRQKELVGVTARAYKPSKLRYIMLRKSDDEPLIFNIERVDLSKPVYAFEGAFDSMFVENSIAASGIDFSKIGAMIPKERTIVIVDNQPRNKEVIQRLDKTVAAGFPMFVWPNRKDLKKDVNQNVIDNIIPADKVKKFIDDNVYSGMILKLKLTDWKKLEINANGNFSTSHRR